LPITADLAFLQDALPDRQMKRMMEGVEAILAPTNDAFLKPRRI